MDVFKAWAQDKPLHKKDVRQVIFRQIFFTGQMAFRLIAFGAAIFGVLTVAQSGAQLSRLGGSNVIGGIVVGAFLRELGPLLTVIVVIARSVSAIASELASMRANGEIDGLRGMGISPLSYLAVPRILSGALSTMLLAMHFVWIALFVGFAVAQVYIDIPWSRYFERVTSSLTMTDLVIFFVKTFVVGFIAFTIACFCGLRTTGATFEVPQATTKAVVSAFMFGCGVQISISAIYYILLLQRAGMLGML